MLRLPIFVFRIILIIIREVLFFTWFFRWLKVRKKRKEARRKEKVRAWLLDNRFDWKKHDREQEEKDKPVNSGHIDTERILYHNVAPWDTIRPVKQEKMLDPFKTAKEKMAEADKIKQLYPELIIEEIEDD